MTERKGGGEGKDAGGALNSSPSAEEEARVFDADRERDRERERRGGGWWEDGERWGVFLRALLQEIFFPKISRAAENRSTAWRGGSKASA